jgi:hypothetical protein
MKAVKVAAAFAGREALAVDEFYARYFREKGIPLLVVEAVRKILEEQLGVDMSRLIAEDEA